MIIALSGKARSGKTTAAEAIASMDARCKIVSFAAPLKRMVIEHFGLTEDQIINGKDNVITMSDGREMTVRQLMIEFGRLYRAIDKNYWISKALKSAHPHLASGGIVIIDDMRYRSEADMLRSMGAKLVRIERPGVKLIDDPSETELDSYPFTTRANNTGDLSEYMQVAMLLGRNLLR